MASRARDLEDGNTEPFCDEYQTPNKVIRRVLLENLVILTDLFVSSR